MSTNVSTPKNGERLDFSGQVALVTGGGRGLGRAFAQALACRGAKVAVTARTEQELAETVGLIEEAGGTAIALPADVTDHPEVIRVVESVEEQLGPVDVLANNAGVLGPSGRDWEVDVDDWWHTFDVNLRGCVSICSRRASGHDRSSSGPDNQHFKRVGQYSSTIRFRIRCF